MKQKIANPIRKLALATLLSLGLIPTGATANGMPEQTTASSLSIAPAETKTVYKHGLCRRVKNANSQAILVPLENSAEWKGGSSFTGNIADMTGVTVTPCAPTGFDVAFCYYQMNRGGYGAYCGPTSIGTMNPRLLRGSGAFDVSTETLKDIIAINQSHRCNVTASTIMFSDPQRAYDQVKNNIDWSSGRDWCILATYSYVSDHMMEGGDSGSGYNAVHGLMRVWNPSMN